jgi:AraC-like DNA-binding protein
MHFSQDMHDNLKWLKDILIVVVVFNNILMPIFISLPKTEYFQILSPIFFSATYLFVFLKALQNPNILKNIPLEVIGEDGSVADPIPNDEDYAIFQMIDKYIIERQPYLEKTFSLLELTEGIGKKRNQVSRALNMITKDNFFNYVNRYRVEYAKTLLIQENILQRYTIESIGTRCGFGSKSGFFSTFKKWEGCSPQEYREKNLERVDI